MITRIRIGLYLTLILLGFVTSCAPVKAYQRAILAHPCMTEENRPEELFAKQHRLGARESSQGATGETGGGCGCN